MASPDENPGRCATCGHKTQALKRTMTRFTEGEDEGDKPRENFVWWSCEDDKCRERMAEARRKANP